VSRNRRVGRLFATIAVVASVSAVGLATSSPVGAADPAPNGYWLLTGHGGVFSFGEVPNFGAPASVPTRCPVSPVAARAPQPNGTCWTMASTPHGRGYWVMNSLTGAIYRYGDAGNFGDPHTKFAGTPAEFLPVSRQIVSTPTGNGYWVYEIGASDIGVVDTYGDAGFFGDTTTLVNQHKVAGYNGRPVGMAKTPDGKGYWEVYSDGGVFAFGSARFLGSMAGHPLAAPIVGMTVSTSGKGYLLAASDGGVFAFGDYRFAGSMGGQVHRPIVSIASNPAGPGYWLASDHGEVFTFGGATFYGTLASTWGVHDHVYAIVTKRG
jgi:hypothetical protein